MIDGYRVYIAALPAKVEAVDQCGLVLPRRESGSYTIGGHLGECIDSGSVSVLILRCVGMNGNEKISLHAPGNAEALFEHEEAIIVAGKRHAHPARLEQFAADSLRHGKGYDHARKSFVEGKSVSVLVDLGCARLIYSTTKRA